MSVGTQWRVLGISLSTGPFLCLAGAASAQNIVVDAAPAHVVNSFSPPRALGGAIDRLGINGGRSKCEE